MKRVVWQDFTVYNPKGVTVLDFFIAFRAAIAKTIDANHWSFLWKSCHWMEDKDGYIKWVQSVAQDKMLEEFYYYSSNIEPYEHGDGWPIICKRPPWWKGLPYWHMPLLDHQPPAYQETSLADFLTSTQSRLSGFHPSFLRGRPRDWPDDLPDIPEIEYLFMNINVQNIESMEPKFKEQEMMKEYHDIPNETLIEIALEIPSDFQSFKDHCSFALMSKRLHYEIYSNSTWRILCQRGEIGNPNGTKHRGLNWRHLYTMIEEHIRVEECDWCMLGGKTMGKETIPCSTCDSVQLNDQIKLLHRPWDSVTLINPDNKSRFGGPPFEEWINSLEGIFVNHLPHGFSMVIAGSTNNVYILLRMYLDQDSSSTFNELYLQALVTILDILQGIRDILQSNQSYRDNDIGEWWIANTWAVEVLSSRHNIPNKRHSLGEVFKIMAVKFIGCTFTRIKEEDIPILTIYSFVLYLTVVRIPGIKVKLPVDITIAKNDLAIINNN
ncbi:hypothetical protein BT96DRAFT_938954 [Gymnopus androsaceus JB14]|uniref:F-box domain-containing protein n=1 Tax=Gymnopus androsaceus JB14 TaxID=1447944 RepID=A0A6A4HQ01_9AGAR|nr:hypothetical protein BT96DRAFT_938954 [Gymnopus androsaceus JB14]